MKKFVTGLCAALLLFSMCGCSDATTNVSDKNEALITVGNEKITKGDVYNGLIAQGDITYVTDALSKAIAAKAVETTDEIKESAQATLDTLKTSNTDWDAYLENNGYESEDELLENLIIQIKETKITSQYVTDEYETLATHLQPRKLQIVSITNADVVNEAQEKAQEGTEFEELAATYGNGTYSGVTTVYTNASGLAASVWTAVEETKEGEVSSQPVYDAGTTTYYLIKVISSATNEFKDEAIPVIAALSATNDDGLTMSEEAFKYFLKKFKYSIHDATVYSALLNESAQYERD